MKKGKLIVFSGPSGVGKNTVRKLFDSVNDLNLYYSVSHTTRPIRVGEVHGKDYFFISREKFDEMIKNKLFLENAEFVGNKYGTSSEIVNEKLNEGKNVILEIEVAGAKQVMNKVKDAVSIFLVPPSFEDLEKRLRTRATESDEKIKLRLLKASEEMKSVDLYKYVVVNDEPQRAADEIIAIIRNLNSGK
jgi:guanylate kinase